MSTVFLEAPRRLVDVTVDGTTVRVPEGATLLEACRQQGIDTPTLCYLENLTPVNVCRVCVVEVERIPDAGAGLLAEGRARHGRAHRLRAGAHQPADGAGVPGVLGRHVARLARRAPLDGALRRRPGPVRRRRPRRTRPGNATRPGPASTTRAEGSAAETVAQPVKVDNDSYVRDYSRCILCYKCVEACGEDAQNTFAIAVAGRGFDARISTEFDVGLPDSACVYCGNCIGVCPTGALMFKSEHDMRQDGSWDESRQTVTTTICPYCGVGCNLELHVQDNRIVKVTSPLDHDVSHGHLCVKGRFGFEFVQRRAGEP